MNPEHRATIFTNICQSFSEIRSHLVIRVALWIIGEYAQSQDEVVQAFKSVKRNVGSLPIYAKPSDDLEVEDAKEEEVKETGPKVITKTIVLPDGSYGTQTVVLEDEASRAQAAA